jgi:hypothetical protein
MGFWETIEKDIKKNIKEGLEFFKEGGTAVSQKIEQLTEEGKRKYKIFTLKMKVQDEFSRLGGKIYDLSSRTKNPMTNRSIKAIISRIQRLEKQIADREQKYKQVKKKSKKPVSKKARVRR